MLPLLLLSIWTVAAPIQPGAEAIPRAAREAIESANKEWVPAMQRRDAAAIGAAYADDAVFVAANGVVANGRHAIEQLMRDRFEAMGRVVGGSIVQEGLRRQGSLIYEWGHGTVDMAHGGGVTRSTGRYLTVWQASAQGRWRIVRNLSLPE